MKKCILYYSEERIISYLCRIRVSYAQKRNKKHLLNDLTSKEYHTSLEDHLDQYDKNVLDILDRIMPKRRLWVTLDKKSIYENGKKLNSVEKNRKCLLFTIKKYRRQEFKLDFVIELDKYIKEIRESIESKNYKISRPDIFPEIKEKSKSKIKFEKKEKGYNETRPIARFELKDRIILSITNKYLTNLFDGYFEECALAFRSVNFIDKIPVIKNHHTAIEKIIEYKNKYPQVNLNVAECDMMKFYDTVNHRVCLKAFNVLILKVESRYPNLDLSIPIYLFNEYLRSYSFQDNVDPLNFDENYWTEKGFKCKFPWVKSDIEISAYYKKNMDDRIGVPQGGALSGLIANIVLDNADKQLSAVKDLFYVRYCDDMILMHPDEDSCKFAIDLFVKIINGSHMFNHCFKSNFSNINPNYNKEENVIKTCNGMILNRAYEKSIKGFWKEKSKGPYKWGLLDIDRNTFPWIGFVGYEINYKCETRVRLRSLKKEIEKQKRVIQNILKAVRSQKVVVNDTIIKSAFEKLNGMSIGRIELYNYQYYKPQMCWAVGFRYLNFNLYSKRQLKLLDRNKYKQIHRLKMKLGLDIVKKSKGKKNEKNLEIMNYYKPFSYYYQAGERKIIK